MQGSTNSVRKISRCDVCEQGIIVRLLLNASGEESSIANAPCVIVSASTFWRNAWKYQARAYRHCYWDNGTILANLLAASAARKIPAKVVLGFVDAIVNRLLGLDSRREAPLSLVALGPSSATKIGPSPPMPAAGVGNYTAIEIRNRLPRDERYA